MPSPALTLGTFGEPRPALVPAPREGDGGQEQPAAIEVIVELFAEAVQINSVALAMVAQEVADGVPLEAIAGWLAFPVEELDEMLREQL